MIQADLNKEVAMKIFDLFRKENIKVADGCKIMAMGMMTLFRTHGTKEGFFEFLDSCKLQWEEDDKYLDGKYESLD